MEFTSQKIDKKKPIAFCIFERSTIQTQHSCVNIVIVSGVALHVFCADDESEFMCGHGMTAKLKINNSNHSECTTFGSEAYAFAYDGRKLVVGLTDTAATCVKHVERESIVQPW